jgi:hypothetical protein
MLNKNDANAIISMIVDNILSAIKKLGHEDHMAIMGGFGIYLVGNTILNVEPDARQGLYEAMIQDIKGYINESSDKIC